MFLALRGRDSRDPLDRVRDHKIDGEVQLFNG